MGQAITYTVTTITRQHRPRPMRTAARWIGTARPRRKVTTYRWAGDLLVESDNQAEVNVGHRRFTVNPRGWHYDIYRPLSDAREITGSVGLGRRLRVAAVAAAAEAAEDLGAAAENQARTRGQREYSDLELSDAAASMLAESWSAAEPVIKRRAASWYRSAPDSRDAVDYLCSETYSSLIERIVNGYEVTIVYRLRGKEAKRKVRQYATIPEHPGQWMRYAASMVPRYWKSRQMGSENVLGRLLGEDDTSVETKINAERMQYDDNQLISVLVGYYERAMGSTARPEAREMIGWLVRCPDSTWSDGAAELGISVAAYKKRLQRVRSALRVGCLLA